MSSEIIALILDTNILRRSEKAKQNMSELSLEPYEEAVNMIEINDLIDTVNIFIPEIVLLELASQKLNKINERIKTLKIISEEFIEVPGIEIKGHTDFDTTKYIETIKDTVFAEVNCIGMPDNWGLLFNQVLEMALDKIPPFEKGESDKGFKDALILLSIINFAKEEDYSKYILFTFDNSFERNKDRIQEFFINETGKYLEIERNKDIQGYISNKYNLFMDFRRYLKTEFYPEADNLLSGFKNIVIEEKGIVCEIQDFEINKEETVINQISEEEYELILAFNLSYKCKDSEIEEINDIIREYTFYKNEDTWEFEEKEFNYRVF